MNKKRKKLAVLLILAMAFNLFMQGSICNFAQAKSLENPKQLTTRSEENVDKDKSTEEKEKNSNNKENLAPESPEKNNGEPDNKNDGQPDNKNLDKNKDQDNDHNNNEDGNTEKKITSI